MVLGLGNKVDDDRRDANLSRHGEGHRARGLIRGSPDSSGFRSTVDRCIRQGSLVESEGKRGNGTCRRNSQNIGRIDTDMLVGSSVYG